ncbi:DUF3179 domain-containing protein [Candidatus Leptofilum sp.]|uniref:DUF3179 domain-containing protein n=1 Tax=Candidatus Leptofilum sp. TaxID=3241576 RepID=UPI003B5C128C
MPDVTATAVPIPTPTNCTPSPDIRQFPIAPWPNTDFCHHSLPYETFRYGGVGKDRIAAIDSPAIETIAEADSWLTPQEPVLVLQLDGIARAYPLSILLWHEIVNDELNGRSVVVTYCPLCNSGLAFERRVDGQTLDFGTTGILHNANLVMYDRQTESWWQQLTGTAVVGELTGTQLPLLPTRLVSWQTFKNEFPQGEVLSIFTGFDRRYSENPYINYDSLVSRGTKFYDGVLDERLHPKMRVMGLQLGSETIAYPFSALEANRVLNDTFAGQPLVVLWQPGTQSPLYAEFISASKEVGSAAVFSREVAGHLLTFEAQADGFLDMETGSEWTFWGTAISGPLLGTQLEQLPGHELFWFAWAAQHPHTAVYQLAD